MPMLGNGSPEMSPSSSGGNGGLTPGGKGVIRSGFGLPSKRVGCRAEGPDRFYALLARTCRNRTARRFRGRALWGRWRHCDRSGSRSTGPVFRSTKRPGQAWRFCCRLLVWLPPSSMPPSRQRRCPLRDHPRDHDDDRRNGLEPMSRTASEGRTLRLAFGVLVCGLGYLSRLWRMQATRMVVDDFGSIVRPFWKSLPRQERQKVETSYCGRAVEWGCGGCDSTAFGRSGNSTFVASSPPAFAFFIVACGSNPPRATRHAKPPRGSDQDRPCRLGQ